MAKVRPRPGLLARRRRRPRRSVRRLAAAGLLAAALAVLFLGWWERPPRNPGDLCAIFAEKRSWHRSARVSFAAWGVPEAVQMAVIHQESGFRARARPPRRTILWIFPGRRRSSAYGYAQAIDATWQAFRDRAGRPDADRHDFDDVAHFVGWYGTEIHRQTGIAKDDAERLYLAYHEGPAGYRRGSHQQKAWLLDVARRVGARARAYQRQYDACGGSLWRWQLWHRLKLAGAWLAAAGIAWLLWRRQRRRGRRRR